MSVSSASIKSSSPGNRFWQAIAPERPYYTFRLPPGNMPLRDGEVRPESLESALVLSECDRRFSEYDGIVQDAVWAAEAIPEFPWIEAMLGCVVTATKGRFALRRRFESLRHIPLNIFSEENAWFEKYDDILQALVSHARGRYPVAVPRIRGGMEILFALAGTETVLAGLRRAPEELLLLLSEVNDFSRRLLKRHTAQLEPYAGGYITEGLFLWAPEPCIIHHDAGLDFLTETACFPLAEYLGKLFSPFRYAFLEMPSLSVRRLEPLLSYGEIPGTVISFNIDGPSLRDTLPFLREIQSKNKYLVLSCPPDTEDLASALEHLSYEKLFLCFQGTTPREAVFWSRYFSGREFLRRHKIGETRP